MFDIKALPTSSSMEVMKLVSEKRAKGEKVFSLSVGDPHFKVPECIQEDIFKAFSNNQTHYTNAKGIPELRASIASRYENKYTPDEIVITHGVKNGLLSYMQASPAKKVCLLEPTWLGYHGICVMTEKEIARINTYDANWLDQLEMETFDLLLVCSPNNPDGNVFSENEIDRIYAHVQTQKAYLLLDEIYADFCYDGIMNASNKLHGKDDVVVFSGFSKSHATTGLRLGYIATKDEEIIKDIVKIQQNSITCVSTPLQHGLIDFQKAESNVEEFKAYYAKNRSLIQNFFPNFNRFAPQAGFYFFIDLESLGINISGTEFCKQLMSEENVALVPGDAYGKKMNNYVRLSFCMDYDDLKEGLQRIDNYIKRHF